MKSSTSLQRHLDALKAGFVKKAPAEVLEIMARATQNLRRSGIMERVLGVGEQAPSFEIPNPEGGLIRSADLLAQGPLVLTFYRGIW